jgi:biopolymer transport protein ExbB
MVDFLNAGGPVAWILMSISIVGLGFILDRAFALRTSRVIPPVVEEALDNCRETPQLGFLKQVCEQKPSALSRLLVVAVEHLEWPKAENRDALQTRARHEVARLERGLVVLEIIVGIAPLLGLVGTIHGLIILFGDLGRMGISDHGTLARGIAIALHTTLMGLLVAIPSLVAWSYFNKRVENLAVEMESLCDEFLQRFYRYDTKD